MTHIVLIYAVCIVNWLWNFRSWNIKKYCTIQPVKLGDRMSYIPGNGKRLSIFSFVYHFSLLLHVPKITRLGKIYISTSKSYLSEVNFSPRWINTLGHILMDTMADSPVWFIMITNIIYYNPIPHMVVPFLLVPIHIQAQCQSREKKRGHTATK